MQIPTASSDIVVQRGVTTLRDKTRVFIWPMARTDGEQERAFIEGLSPARRRLGFLGQLTTPSDTLVAASTVLHEREP